MNKVTAVGNWIPNAHEPVEYFLPIRYDGKRLWLYLKWQKDKLSQFEGPWSLVLTTHDEKHDAAADICTDCVFAALAYYFPKGCVAEARSMAVEAADEWLKHEWRTMRDCV